MSKQMSDPLTNTSDLRVDSLSIWDPMLKRYVDLRNPAPQDSTYTKVEVDTRLAVIADQADLLVVSDAVAAKQDALTFTAPLSLSRGIVDVDLSAKADQADLLVVSDAVAAKQDALTFAAPLSLSAGIVDVDLSGKQDALTFTAPLSLSGGSVGVDLTGKQDALTFATPLSVSEGTVSLGDDLTVQTVRTTGGGLTLDAPGVIAKGDLAVDAVLLTSNIQPRLGDVVNINGDAAVSGGLAVTGDLSAHGATFSGEALISVLTSGAVDASSLWTRAASTCAAV